MIEKLSVVFVPEFLVYKRIMCRQGWEIKNWFILSHAYRHSKTLCFMGSLQKCFFFFSFFALTVFGTDVQKKMKRQLPVYVRLI